MKNFKLILSLFLTLSVFTQSVHSITETGKAVMKVVAALKIERVSDLDFGIAEPGAPEKKILPGRVDTLDNASFNITGEPNRSYQILLPADGEVLMTTRDGKSRNRQVAVNHFSSYPLYMGWLDSQGKQLLLVGAERAALPLTQESGDYEGLFKVSVIY